MSNYKQSNVSGTKWQRARVVTILNEYQQPPKCHFQEEEIVELSPGDFVRKDAGFCEMPFDPQSGTIPLINPETGVPTGTSVSHAELYVILHSLYIQTAQARDAAQQQ